MWLCGELWRRSLVWLNLPGRNAAKNVTPIHRNTADRTGARGQFILLVARTRASWRRTVRAAALTAGSDWCYF